jgi:glycosyltransferase involved in cell wall biosynthesis
MPVYNVQDFLRKSLDCIRNQHYQNFEVIMVNDGSSDSSPAICEEYVSKDGRFKLVHQLNQGFGAARNTGLQHASGEFVYFMDSDDLIEPELFTDVMKAFEEFPYDTVFFGFTKIYQQSGKSFAMIPPSYNCKNAESTREGIRHMLFKGFGFGVWQQLFRREFLVASNARFPTLKREADVAFLLGLYQQLRSFKTLPKIYYLYQAFYSSHKNNPDILRNHVILYRLLERLVLDQRESKISGMILSRYFVLWFCHVIPLHIYLNEKTSFGQKWSEFIALLNDPDFNRGLTTVKHLKFGSWIQAMIILIYRMRSAGLVYFLTSMNYLFKYKLNVNYKKLYYGNIKP